MKIKNILSMTLLFVAALLIQSCSDKDSVTASGLSVTGATEDALTFESPAGNKMIGITTDGNWTISVPDADTTWLSVTPHAGYGWNYTDSTAKNTNAYVKVMVQKNTGASRTSTITVSTGNLTKEIKVTQKGVGMDSNDPFESVYTLIENIKVGYNWGNTLDSNPSGDWWTSSIAGLSGRELALKYEQSWGQPVTEKVMIDSLAAAGFNIIRVPVTWGPHLDANNKIDAEWMKRVKEVVDYVISNNCYCIINVMHDTGTEGWLRADMDKYADETVKYQAIWKQIAEEFKSYDEKLIFESFNEILDSNGTWTAPADGSKAYEAINKLQQDFVNTVRATGGNNEYRNLAITTYAATGNVGSGDPLAALTVPADKHPNHIYLSIHSYDPYNFCNYNAGKNTDGTSFDYNKSTWDQECTETIDKLFTRVNAASERLGIPYIFGEFGAIDASKNIDERIKYIDYVAGKLKANGTSGLWWMGLYDRKTQTWINNYSYTDKDNVSQKLSVDESSLVQHLMNIFAK